MSKIEITDFRKTEDKTEQINEIYQAMVALAKNLAFVPPDATLDKRIALPYPRTKELKFPLGYELCDGKNETDDLRNSFTDDFVFIQRVK